MNTDSLVLRFSEFHVDVIYMDLGSLDIPIKTVYNCIKTVSKLYMLSKI